MQQILGAELTESLGCAHDAEASPVQTNLRNDVSRKTVKAGDGAFKIEVPRNREGSFERRSIAKGLLFVGPDVCFIFATRRLRSTRQPPVASNAGLFHGG